MIGLTASPAGAQMDPPESGDMQQQGGIPTPMPPPSPYGAPPAYGAPTSYGGGSELTSQLLSRVQNLEDQVRTLRGQVEELQNQGQRQQADLAKQVSDLQFQLQQGGGHAASSESGVPPPSSRVMSPPPGVLGETPASSPSAEPATPPVSARRTADVMLQDGAAALARRDYRAAEAAARDVLAQGRSARSYDAQFLLGQAEAGQRNYQQAAIAFDDTYNHSRAGSHAQDSLLGLASALYNLGDKGAACGALNKLRTAFPSVRGDLRDAVSGLRGRAGCN